MWAIFLLLACEPVVTDDDDCTVWADACGGCATLCSPTWEVPEETCDVDCELDLDLPRCVARDGSCVFAD